MSETNNSFLAAVAVLAVGLLGLLLWPPLPAQAQSASIIVDTKKDEATPDDGRCSLREAVQNANDNAQTSPDCNAGGGEDTITFKKGLSGTIRLDPASGPLAVTDPAGLTISGGKDNVTVSGDDEIQVFSVSPGAKLAMEDLTVARGFAKIHDPNGEGDRGGGIVNDGGVLKVTRSTFSNNNASNVGGGIANINNGTLAVTNSTFSGNKTAGAGGAIVNNGTLTVAYSTFSGNDAEFGGGAIQNAFVGASTATLSNTILANSMVGDTKGDNCRGTILDGGYNISDDPSCAFATSTSKNSTNPKLDRSGLQNNGGPTQTIALKKTSPAIDYIPEGENGCGTTVKTDQRGVKRPQDEACDVGAYELK